jgi:hypothetical protein
LFQCFEFLTHNYIELSHRFYLFKRFSCTCRPTTTRFVTVVVFNAFVDTGYCYPDVLGAVFTDRATFHLQRWTGKDCGLNAIVNIPKIKDEYRHTELIDSIGNYLQAPRHFGPQQLPRRLRLLATAPVTAKVLVAKGGVVTSDRIVLFDKDIRLNHFANIVYRSDPWSNSTGIHDRTDIQLVHRFIAADPLQPNQKKIPLVSLNEKMEIHNHLLNIRL